MTYNQCNFYCLIVLIAWKISTVACQSGDFQFECPQSEGQFKNPDDCGSFYKCHDGQPDLCSCSDGLHFNDLRKTCDYMELAHCQNDGLVANNQKSKYAVPSRNVQCETPTCPCIYASTTDCAEYYRCQGGIAYLERCSDGLFMNPEKLSCDFEENVQCDISASTSSFNMTISITTTMNGSVEESTTTTEYVTDVKSFVDQTASELIDIDYEDTTLFENFTSPSNNTITINNNTWTTLSTDGIFWTSSVINNSSQDDSLLNTTENTLGPLSTSSSKRPTQSTAILSTSTTSSISDCNCGKCKLPDATDCSKYYLCLNGKRSARQCPEGLLFNVDISDCDSAENVQCYTFNKTCFGETGYFPDIDDCSGFLECRNNAVFVRKCPPGLFYNSEKRICDLSSEAFCGNMDYEHISAESREYAIDCDCDLCTVPDAQNCSKYYMCVNNIAYAGLCEDGLLFNPKMENCDFAKNVICPNSSPECFEMNGQFGNAENCSEYFNCIGGISYKRECPPRLHFDEENHNCTDPCVALCDETLDCTSTTLINTTSTLLQTSSSLENDVNKSPHVTEISISDFTTPMSNVSFINSTLASSTSETYMNISTILTTVAIEVTPPFDTTIYDLKTTNANVETTPKTVTMVDVGDLTVISKITSDLEATVEPSKEIDDLKSTERIQTTTTLDTISLEETSKTSSEFHITNNVIYTTPYLTTFKEITIINTDGNEIDVVTTKQIIKPTVDPNLRISQEVTDEEITAIAEETVYSTDNVTNEIERTESSLENSSTEKNSTIDAEQTATSQMYSSTTLGASSIEGVSEEIVTDDADEIATSPQDLSTTKNSTFTIDEATSSVSETTAIASRYTSTDVETVYFTADVESNSIMIPKNSSDNVSTAEALSTTESSITVSSESTSTTGTPTLEIETVAASTEAATLTAENVTLTTKIATLTIKASISTSETETATETETLETKTATSGTETATSATETPTSVTETPTSVTETPTSATDTPASATETTTETEASETKTATSGTETPTSVTETPTSETETPTSATETATSATETATSTTENPTSATETATSETETATSATETSTSATETATSATETATSAIETTTSTTETATATTETETSATETATSATETAISATETETAATETTTSTTETATATTETATSATEIATSASETATSTSEMASETQASTTETATSTSNIATPTTKTATSTMETATSTTETATSTTETATSTTETATSTTETATLTTETATSTTETATSTTETATSTIESSSSATEFLTYINESSVRINDELTHITEHSTPITETSPLITNTSNSITLFTYDTESSTYDSESSFPIIGESTSITQSLTPITESLTSITQSLTPITETLIPINETLIPTTELSTSIKELIISSTEISPPTTELSTSITELSTSNPELSTHITDELTFVTNVIEVATFSELSTTSGESTETSTYTDELAFVTDAISSNTDATSNIDARTIISGTSSITEVSTSISDVSAIITDTLTYTTEDSIPTSFTGLSTTISETSSIAESSASSTNESAFITDAIISSTDESKFITELSTSMVKSTTSIMEQSTFITEELTFINEESSVSEESIFITNTVPPEIKISTSITDDSILSTEVSVTEASVTETSTSGTDLLPTSETESSIIDSKLSTLVTEAPTSIASTTGTDESTTGTVASSSGTYTFTYGIYASTSGTDISTSGTDESPSGADASTSGADASTSGTDASTSGTDASTSGTDASTSGTDASTSGTDALTSDTDASTSSTAVSTSGSDASTSGTDASTSGTGVSPYDTEVPTYGTEASTPDTETEKTVTVIEIYGSSAMSKFETVQTTTDGTSKFEITEYLQSTATSKSDKLVNASTENVISVTEQTTEYEATIPIKSITTSEMSGTKDDETTLASDSTLSPDGFTATDGTVTVEETKTGQTDQVMTNNDEETTSSWIIEPQTMKLKTTKEEESTSINKTSDMTTSEYVETSSNENIIITGTSKGTTTESNVNTMEVIKTTISDVFKLNNTTIETLVTLETDITELSSANVSNISITDSPFTTISNGLSEITFTETPYFTATSPKISDTSDIFSTEHFDTLGQTETIKTEDLTSSEVHQTTISIGLEDETTATDKMQFTTDYNDIITNTFDLMSSKEGETVSTVESSSGKATTASTLLNETTKKIENVTKYPDTTTGSSSNFTLIPESSTNSTSAELLVTCGESDGFYPKPNDCEYFYACRHGRRRLLRCPDGLHFSVITSYCEFPCNAKCDSSIECSTRADTGLKTTAAPTFRCRQRDIFSVKGKCNKYLNCTTGTGTIMECPDGLHFNATTRTCDWPYNANCGGHARRLPSTDIRCPCHFCFIPSDYGCAKYRLCLNKRIHYLECSEGLYFDRDYQVCRRAENTLCDRTTTYPTTTAFPTTTSTETYERRFHCRTQNGLFPNPRDCGGFVQCSNWRPYYFRCPDSLHFSENTEKCEYPCDAQCDKNLVCDPFPPFSLSTIPVQDSLCNCGDCIIPSDDDCNNYIVCRRGKAFRKTCPPGQLFDKRRRRCDSAYRVECGLRTRCPELNGLFEYKGDCHKFIHCSNGISTVKLCPNDLEFVPRHQRCERPTGRCGSLDKRQKTTSIKPTSVDVTTCAESFGVFRSLSNCSQYIQCVHGVPVSRSCPAQLVFNEVLKVCDWSRNVDCSRIPEIHFMQCYNSHRYFKCPSNKTIVADPEDCSLFYDCSSDRPCRRRCPRGLIFDNKYSTCNIRERTACITTKPVVDSNRSCEGKFGLIPDPKNSRCYYRCINGVRIRGCCSRNRVFDSRFERCRRPTYRRG